MKSLLAKAYILLTGLILITVGIAGFFRHEMFNLTFPLAHNLFHLLSGLVALFSFSRPNGPRLFGFLFGSIYTLLAFAGFLGLHDLGPIQVGLNIHYNFIHLGVGLLSLLAGLALSNPPLSHSSQTT